jgi:hypothetical protein
VAQAGPSNGGTRTPPPQSEAVKAAVDRLRAARADVAQVKAALEAARLEEVAALVDLHEMGKSWFQVASYAPMADRKREVQRVRTRVHRFRGVTACNEILNQRRNKHGEAASPASPSSCSPIQKEEATMPHGRLIKRTVTEELFDDRACPAPPIDDDDDDAIADEDDLEDADEPAMAANGRTQDSASASGAETAGTEGTGLTGEEE